MNTQPIAPAAPARKTPAFEWTDCTRCGGTGKMPFAVYAGICFKCHGPGYVLTRRGAQAQAYYTRLLSKRAGDVQIGDVYFSAGFTAGSFTQPNRWETVTRIEADAHGQVVLQSEHATYHAAPDTMLRIAHSPAAKRAAQLQALAFQLTLGVNGKTKQNQVAP